MTITRRLQVGWETGSVSEGEYRIGATQVTVQPYGNLTGNYALRIFTNEPGIVGWHIPETAHVRGGFRYRTDSVYTDIELFRFRSAAQADLIEIWHNTYDGHLILKIAGTTQDTSDAQVVPYQEAHFIGLEAYIHDTNGYAYVYVDGLLVCSFDGNTGTTNIGDVIVGNTNDPGSGSRYCYWDDIYVDDMSGEPTIPQAPPIKKFYLIKPNDNGNYNEWTPSSGSGYQCTDEIPPNDDTDYVETNLVNKTESFNLTTRTLEEGEQVVAVIPIAYIKKEGNTEEVQLGTRLSSTDNLGSSQSPSTSYGYLWERQTTKPGGGSWQQSDIDDVEFLIKSSGSF